MGKELCGCNKKEIDTQKILEQNVFNFTYNSLFFQLGNSQKIILENQYQTQKSVISQQINENFATSRTNTININPNENEEIKNITMNNQIKKI